MHSLRIPALCLLLLAGSAAHASEAIVKKARCVACHTVDQKRVGPAYQEVAAKYKGDTKAAARLFDLLRQADRLAGPHGRIAFAPVPESGLGLAINDRLRRAAAPRP